MHQNQNHKQSNYFDLVDGLGRPSDIIQNRILMHKLFRIHSVFFLLTYAAWLTEDGHVDKIIGSIGLFNLHYKHYSFFQMHFIL